MARCSLCGAATELYVNGTPICLKCNQERQTKKPPQQVPDKKRSAYAR